LLVFIHSLLLLGILLGIIHIPVSKADVSLCGQPVEEDAVAAATG